MNVIELTLQGMEFEWKVYWIMYGNGFVLICMKSYEWKDVIDCMKCVIVWMVMEIFECVSNDMLWIVN